MRNGSGSNITIDNSTIKGLGNESMAPGIYSKNVGSIEIKNNSKIEGSIGIVAEGGNITINGGTITATGVDSALNNLYNFERKTLKNFEQKLLGAAVLVDNTGEDSDKALVTINGGEFIALSDNSLISAGDTDSDFSVGGGIYNKPFKNEFVVPNKLELKITKGEDAKWYVGQDAENMYKEVKDNAEYTIDIIQGELPVEQDNSPGSDGENKPDTEQNETGKPEDSNETNPNTADNIIFFVVLLIISAVGIGGAVYFKRKMNK